MAAARPAVPVPPVTRSVRIRKIPDPTTTNSPKPIPSNPAVATLAKFSVPPRAKAKKGIITGTARPKNSRNSESIFPSIIPQTKGSTLPTSVCHGKPGKESLINRTFTQEMAGDQTNYHTQQNLCCKKAPSFFRNVPGHLQVDRRAHTNVEHSENRQRSAKKRGSK